MFSMRKLLESLVGKKVYLVQGDYGNILKVYHESALPSNPYTKIVEIGDDLLKIEYFNRETDKKYNDTELFIAIDSVKEILFNWR